MRPNHRLQRPLAIWLVTLMLCMNLVLQFNIRPVQADAGNLADKAVAFIKTQYQSEGAQNDPSAHFPYVAYTLKSAGVDVTGWVYNQQGFETAIYNIVDTDINNNALAVKHLAEDLICMQAWNHNSRLTQLQERLHNRQKNDGSFLNDTSAYSIIPAYELLGKAGQLGMIDKTYAQTYIMGQQNATGAWPSGNWPDFMTTAQAVRALAYLAPGAAADSSVGQAITKGCDWLKAQQKTDGSFTPSAWDDPLIDTAETIATQKALGLNPAVAWTNNGKSAVDYLNNAALNADGSFGASQNLMDAAWVLDSCRILSVFPSASSVANGGNTGAVPLNCTPGIAVVGMNGEILYGPSSVNVVKTNNWGLTALGTLDATGLSYIMSSQWTGFVESIAGQANNGSQGWMYTVNGTAPMVLAKDYTVSSSDQVIWYYSKSMSQSAPTWAQLSSGTNATSINAAVVTSTSGNAAVNPATGGRVALGSEAEVTIPAGALTGTNAVTVAVQKLSSPPPAPSGFNLLGEVFEFTVDNQTDYKFNQPVTLSFNFDPKSLTSGQTPTVYYFDEKTSQWVSLGGTVTGSTISVKVDHFTKFAILSKTVVTTAVPHPEKTFVDVPGVFWASVVIKDLSGRGYINGYPDGSFKPDNKISRAEFVAIINKMLKLSSYQPVQADFKDVCPADWYYQAVENGVHAGIVKGYGQEFLPNQEISREELATILVNALDKKDQVQTNMQEKSSFTDDASISNWARGYVIAAAQQGLIKGYPDQRFNPQGKASRAEACSMIIHYLNLNKTKS